MIKVGEVTGQLGKCDYVPDPRAVLTAARQSRDADELRRLLDMLGLSMHQVAEALAIARAAAEPIVESLARIAEEAAPTPSQNPRARRT